MPSRDPTKKIVKQWLDAVAARSGWKRRGLLLWTMGKDFRIAIHARRCTFGPMYFLDGIVFPRDDAAIKTNSVRAMDIPLASITRKYASALGRAVDFPDRPTKGSLAYRRRIFTGLVAGKLVPAVLRFGSRDYLARQLERRRVCIALAASKALGVKPSFSERLPRSDRARPEVLTISIDVKPLARDKRRSRWHIVS